MASIAKVLINWTGFIGAPGYTNLYFRNATPGIIDQSVVDNAVSKVEALVTAIRPVLPNTVTIGTNASVEEINDATGELVAFWTGTVAAPVVGGQLAAYSAASGAVMNWSTNTVRNGRRIRGRTFIVPLGGSSFDTNGTLDSSELTILQNAATALRAASGAARLVIWARPVPEQPGPPVVPAVAGASAEVTSSNVPDMGAILTSRRS